MSSYFNLDGQKYPTENLSKRAKQIIYELQQLEVNLKEKNNLKSIFKKAHKNCLLELKKEILSKKSGFDFTE